MGDGGFGRPTRHLADPKRLLLNPQIPIGKDDLDRLFAEQRQKLCAFGIFPDDVTEARSITTSTGSPPAQALPQEPTGSRKTLPAPTLPSDFGKQVSNSVLPIAQPSRLGSLSTTDSLEGITAADILQKIRVRSSNTRKEANKATNRPSVSDDTKTKTPANRQIKRPDTKTLSDITVNKEVSQLLEHIRSSGDARQLALPDEGNLNYLDVTARTIGQDAAIHIMKTKVAAKNTELEAASQQVSKNKQLAQKKSTEIEKLQEEHRLLKERQASQEHKLGGQVKQLEAVKGKTEKLTKEVDRLSRELVSKKKASAVRKKNSVPDISVNRYACANERTRKELDVQKEQNAFLQEIQQTQQNELRNQKETHRVNLRRLMLIVQKQNALVKIKTRQRDFICLKQLLSISESNFRGYLNVPSVNLGDV